MARNLKIATATLVMGYSGQPTVRFEGGVEYGRVVLNVGMNVPATESQMTTREQPGAAHE